MNVVEAKVEVGVERERQSDFLACYLETLSYIERLHRLLLDVIKDEFERIGQIDINSVQALLIFNIGDNEVTAGELRTRGYYQGSNVSYNLKKLVEAGYIDHKRCEVDRRAVRISLTDSGREVHSVVADLYDKHSEELLGKGAIDEQELAVMNRTMRKLERYWSDQIRYIY